ncbi:hypothetical protein PG994_008366 [Apiospora phragmitis]|uniref:Saccharopine dehydrogenase NADP binding domain-containing protein n=1 Tax=Apiospora phragmitis TaxID=2905665 RepID=A0ABR1UVC0_9PEZI
MDGTSRVIIYGAAGYTGRLASEHAKALGLPTILVGRARASIVGLAILLDVPYRVFDLEGPSIIVSVLREERIKVLLNCAGPFVLGTAAPLIAACIETGVHYLDISAELSSYQLATDRSDDAKAAGVMLLPGCGGSVAMLGCLAGHAAQRIRGPTHIDIALRVAGSMSRGSVVSAAQGSMAGSQCHQRLGNGLVPWFTTDEACRQFDFEDGGGPCFVLPSHAAGSDHHLEVYGRG